MGAKHARFRAVAALAVFSAVCRSTVALAAICPEASSGAAVSCPSNDQPINVFIYELPVTTIYNVVDNSVTLQEISDGLGKPPVNIIKNAPRTTVDNIIDNSINVTTGPRGDPSQSAVLLTPTSQSIVIDNEAVTNIFNDIDNSINIAESISKLGETEVTRIKNVATTKIFNVVDNTINLELSDPLGLPIALFIDSMPTTLIDNWVDNSVNVTVAAPEPSSWSLLALGFCAVGLLRRATRRVKLPPLRRAEHLPASAT